MKVMIHHAPPRRYVFRTLKNVVSDYVLGVLGYIKTILEQIKKIGK